MKIDDYSVTSVTVWASNRPIVTFKSDGTITVADDATPTEAAQELLKVLRPMFANMIAAIREEQQK